MTDPVTRLNAALEGRYRIERQLGEGGMATVYLARDAKHNRNVALKVLKPELAAVVGAERFLAEIETTANLQHPNILPLHDSGGVDGVLFYVMPFVEGESLRERLDREHQLPVEEAVRITRDVAEALEYAHRHGVIHRDIKPANILLISGKPVISDFGIALAVGTAGGSRLTETGLSMGTPHYMSPEQATGDQSVGAGTDVWALGCVLYEMLVGEPPYTGSTPQAILGKIIQGRPASATETRRTVPANVDAVIRRALEKVPADRFGTAGALAAALADPGFRYGEPGMVGAAPGSAGPWKRVALAACTLALALAVALGWVLSSPVRPAGPATTFALDLGGLSQPQEQFAAISPDGRRFAVPTAGPLYVRDAGEPSFTPLLGTGGVTDFSFSPDGDWVAYVRDGELRKISLSGGTPLPLTQPGLRVVGGVHWGESGSIVFEGFDGLHVVADDGAGHAAFDVAGERPHLLPDGGAFLYEDRSSIHLYDIATSSSRELVAEGSAPQYVPTGHILFIHPNGGLFAVPFDVGSRTVTGSPVHVLEVGRPGGSPIFSVARTGTIVYRGGRLDVRASRLVLLHPDGTTEALRLASREFAHLRFSPDGRSIAFNEGTGRSTLRALFTYDLVLNRSTQVASDGGEHAPVWSPDGTQLAYSLLREAGPQGEDIYVRSVLGDDPPRRVVTLPDDQHAGSWTRGGRLAYDDRGDISIVDASTTDGTPIAYLSGDYAESGIAVSPDERWAAYESNEEGGQNVYIRSFPEPGEAWRVSPAGGVAPRWSGDGRTLHYRTENLDTIYAVAVSSGASLTIGQPRVAWVLQGSANQNWDVDRTTGRAVAAQLVDPAAATGPEVRVIVNWFEQLRELMGEGR